jgi:hypothetical protein
MFIAARSRYTGANRPPWRAAAISDDIENPE